MDKRQPLICKHPSLIKQGNVFNAMIDGNTEHREHMKKGFGHDNSRKACLRGIFMAV